MSDYCIMHDSQKPCLSCIEDETMKEAAQSRYRTDQAINVAILIHSPSRHSRKLLKIKHLRDAIFNWFFS